MVIIKHRGRLLKQINEKKIEYPKELEEDIKLVENSIRMRKMLQDGFILGILGSLLVTIIYNELIFYLPNYWRQIPEGIILIAFILMIFKTIKDLSIEKKLLKCLDNWKLLKKESEK